MSFNPKYKQIADRIKQLIDVGEIGTSGPLPTEAELCKRFFVSRSTVTKALDELRNANIIYTVHGSGSYVDNRYSSSSHADFSNIVSVILPFADFNRSDRLDENIILKNLEKQLRKNHFFLMLYYCHDTCDSFYETIKNMQALPHVGVIAYTPQDVSLLPKKHPDICSLLTAKPTILFEQSIPGIDIPCVHQNFLNDSMSATQYLLDCGYTKLFFLSAVSINYNTTIQERYAGMKKALKKNHHDHPLQYIYIQTDGSTTDRTTNINRQAEIISQLVAQYPGERLGFVCYCDYMGIEAYTACQQLGLRVPEDIGIVCFGTINQVLPNGGKLSSVDYDYQKCSELAVKALISIIQNRPFTTPLNPKGNLIIGDTTLKLP